MKICNNISCMKQILSTHNPKVVSSNLAPATKFAPEPLGSGASSVSGIFAVFASDPFSDPYGERTGKV